MSNFGKEVHNRVRYAIISDIHANLEALQVALDDLDSQNIRKIICLGDIIGYYANPNECAELCRNHSFLCLRGNHDDAVVGICGIEGFNPVAQDALLWTERHLSDENKNWLRQLPEQVLVDDLFLAVHGSPSQPYDYILSLASAAYAFDALASNYPRITLCFFGHTHQRALYTYDYQITQELLEENQVSGYSLREENTYLINPGSIGQARDGKPGASYLVYDAGASEIIFRHVPYDANLTQQKVMQAGLPVMLAERLELGF